MMSKVYCEKCGGSGLEREIDSACPICNPDMRAYGDKESDWH